MVERVVLILTLIAALQSICFSIMGPFYPFEAKEKGVTPMSIGWVIGAFSISYIISGIISGKNLSKIGKRNGLKLGLLMLITQLFGLGSLKFIQPPDHFVGLSILYMAIGGAGSALNCTCILSEPKLSAGLEYNLKPLSWVILMVKL